MYACYKMPKAVIISTALRNSSDYIRKLRNVLSRIADEFKTLKLKAGSEFFRGEHDQCWVEGLTIAWFDFLLTVENELQTI